MLTKICEFKRKFGVDFFRCMENPTFKEAFVQNTDYKMLRSQADALFILPLSWVKTALLPVLVIAAAYHPMFPPLKSAGTVTFILSKWLFSLSN